MSGNRTEGGHSLGEIIGSLAGDLASQAAQAGQVAKDALNAGEGAVRKEVQSPGSDGPRPC